jgi:spore coat polysaccharide biosynthesis protein SpsF
MKILNNTKKNKKIGLIVYARRASKRFPDKVFAKINNKENLLESILNILKKSQFNKKIIIATTSNKNDKKIINLCKTKKIYYFAGEHLNVFLRTQKCIKKFNLDYFARICADRPFFNVTLMDKMINIILKKDYDIITNVHPRTYPKGLTCEVANTRIFKSINAKKLNKENQEHIFNYFYNRNKFRVLNIKKKFKKNFLKKNFCIDKKTDLKKIIKIKNYFKKNNLNLTITNLEKYT